MEIRLTRADIVRLAYERYLEIDGHVLTCSEPVGRLWVTQPPTANADPLGKLMATMDGINGRFGRGMVRTAVSGVEGRWSAKAEHVSPCYTTQLEELVSVRA